MTIDPTEKDSDELRAYLNHPDPRQRLNAIEKLSDSGVKDRKLISELTVIARGDPDQSVRDAAEKLLRHLTRKDKEDRHDFWIGFFLWFALNVFLFLLVFYIIPGFPCLVLPINIAVIVYLAFKNKSMAFGMLVALGIAFAIYIISMLFLMTACFIDVINKGGF